eukprot:1142845-Pelagomonas_calceolata.AAC.5
MKQAIPRNWMAGLLATFPYPGNAVQPLFSSNCSTVLNVQNCAQEEPPLLGLVVIRLDKIGWPSSCTCQLLERLCMEFIAKNWKMGHQADY